MVDLRGIPFFACEKLMKQHAPMRIADDAVTLFQSKLEDRVKLITLYATQYCKHAKRNTILPEDIRLALQKIEN